MKQFFGKYRGKVKAHESRTEFGRLLVDVPAVLGDAGGWAMPCVPYAGPNSGFFFLPDVGANVWVEFEGGDPDFPIWSGCFWGKDELPDNVRDARTKVIRTKCGSFVIDDQGTKGGIVIRNHRGQEISMTDSGIELTDGKTHVKLSNGQVTIKDTLDVG